MYAYNRYPGPTIIDYMYKREAMWNVLHINLDIFQFLTTTGLE